MPGTPFEEEAMRNWIPAVLAVAALSAMASGCGSSSTDDSGGGGGPKPDAILACVKAAGLNTASLVSPANLDPGQTGGVQVPIPPSNSIFAYVFEDAGGASAKAKADAPRFAPTGGSSEVVDETAVVEVLKSGAATQLATVKGCVTG